MVEGFSISLMVQAGDYLRYAGDLPLEIT